MPVALPGAELGSYVQKGEALKASKREADRKRTPAIPLLRRGRKIPAREAGRQTARGRLVTGEAEPG